jgi:hypothetical protein
MCTYSSVTIPPVTWIVLFAALVNSISTSNSFSTPPSVTQLKEYDVHPPSFNVPPSIANDFEAVTLIIEVSVYEHTYRVFIPLISITSSDTNDCTESRMRVVSGKALIIPISSKA